MQRVWITVAVCLLAPMPGVPALAADNTAVEAPIISCGNGIPGGIYCAPSKKDLKEARAAYSRGTKLQDQQHLEDAFTQFDEASRLVPDNVKFFSALEMFDSVKPG